MSYQLSEIRYRPNGMLYPTNEIPHLKNQTPHPMNELLYQTSGILYPKTLTKSYSKRTTEMYRFSLPVPGRLTETPSMPILSAL
jgi:hypothetical protein